MIRLLIGTAVALLLSSCSDPQPSYTDLMGAFSNCFVEQSGGDEAAAAACTEEHRDLGDAAFYAKYPTKP